jgi:hypothetical protein
VDRDTVVSYANRVDERASRSAFAEWLAPHSKRASRRTWTYDYFVTVTLKDPTGVGRKWWHGGNHPGVPFTKPGLGSARMALRTVRRHFGSQSGVAVYEMQKGRGVPHVHALISSPAVVDARWVNEWLYERHGISRVLEYDGALGALGYIGKYLFKDDPEFEIWGWPEDQPHDG